MEIRITKTKKNLFILNFFRELLYKMVKENIFPSKRARAEKKMEQQLIKKLG